MQTILKPHDVERSSISYKFPQWRCFCNSHNNFLLSLSFELEQKFIKFLLSSLLLLCYIVKNKFFFKLNLY